MAERLVPLGEIVTTHGLDGWLKLNPFNTDTTCLITGGEVFLDRPGAETVYQLEAVKPFKKQFLIKLRGVNKIDDAERLIGATLSVDEGRLDALKPGQYYHYQVVGFEVFDLNGARIGTIASLMPTAGGELYVIQGTDREYLIPAVREIIERVDFTERKVIVNPPDGLLDL
jgi:16S rRNA processing protein RimM